MRKVVVPKGHEVHFAKLDALMDANGLGDTESSEIVLLMTKDQMGYYKNLVTDCGVVGWLGSLTYNGCLIEEVS